MCVEVEIKASRPLNMKDTISDILGGVRGRVRITFEGSVDDMEAESSRVD